MKVINTATYVAADSEEAEWIYNGHDGMVTSEILGVLLPQLNPNTQRIYDFERSLQGPALNMMLRGVLVDTVERERVLNSLRIEDQRLREYFNKLSAAVGFPGTNPNSTQQLKKIFYDYLLLPKQYNNKGGKRSLTLDKNALENIEDTTLISKALIKCIKAIRETGKKKSTLLSEIDPDGRMRSSLNIGKETGRWSSSKNVFGRGTNMQNLSDKEWSPRQEEFDIDFDPNLKYSIRKIFVPDAGYKMCYSDLERAESFTVAMLSCDKAYIEAHKASDMHIEVAGMVFGVDSKKANTLAFFGFTYRDLAKRAAHAANYLVTAKTLAKYLKLPLEVCQAFLDKYFTMFPLIPDWQANVATVLQTTGKIITALGRERMFFGRLDDEATIREAVAYEPQSIVADVLNIGLGKVWRALDLNGNIYQCLLPVHDAILGQFKEGNENIIEEVHSLMCVPVMMPAGEMIIPVDTKVGYNWHDLKKLGSPESFTQQRATYSGFGLLDRLIS